MPNRILKETICTSDNLDNLKPEEEVLFYRLIVICDDYGITDARLPIIRSKCFPLKVDKIKDKDIEGWLNSLIRAGLVFIYEVEGKLYLKMTSWEKHQQIRAKRSKFPLPDSENNNLISNDINVNQMLADVTVIQSNPIRIQSESESNPNTTSKLKYADYVSMTEDEYNKLITEYGEDLIKDKITDLSLWKGSKGKKTKSDYLTVISWIRKDKKEQGDAKKEDKPTIKKEDEKDGELSGFYKRRLF